MKIKKDDNVIVISGKDRGKTGKVVKSLPREDKVIVAGLNQKKIHKRPSKSGQKGQIIDQSFPIHVSNVLIIDPKTNKGTKTYMEERDGKRVRISKKSKMIIE
jgi:large subunit ribosomal protein L24